MSRFKISEAPVAATLLAASLMLLSCTSMSSQPANKDCVIVMHGLGRTAASMAGLEHFLEEQGYLVWNETYPSTEHNIQTLAATHIPEGVSYCQQMATGDIHFVTHSLGGILVRQYFQKEQVDNLGRIVMLAPPNHGSEVSDNLKDWELYKEIMGPVGQQLTTDKESLVNRLQPINAEVGIIIGNKDSEVFFKDMFSGENDGKVSVESAKLDEMKDFLVVDSGHTMIMWQEYTQQQILHFLKTATFDHSLVIEDEIFDW